MKRVITITEVVAPDPLEAGDFSRFAAIMERAVSAQTDIIIKVGATEARFVPAAIKVEEFG